MRRLLIAVVLLSGLVVVGPAKASFDGVSGGLATPSAFAVDGGTEYSVSLTGKTAVADLVLVLDNSGSMEEELSGSVSKWHALASASEQFVDGLESEGFFARGGKVGLVLFSTPEATIATPPTADVETIKSAIAGAAPSGESCITCGLQRAAELLSVVPGSSTHRRIAYIAADGANTGTSPTVADAVASAEAVGVERRVIGVGAGASGQGLESFASDGTVAYASTAPQLAGAYTAQSTRLPGATDISWSFHLTPGFTASSPTASLGSVAAGGSEVTWTIGSLGAETATLTFHASHDSGAGCAATTLLSGTSFSDAEGDSAPTVPLGPVSVSGCSGPAGGSGPPATAPKCRVPNLKRKKLRSARRRAKAAGCRLGKVTKKKGVTARSGKVVRQRPKPGTVGAAGKKISVVLGT